MILPNQNNPQASPMLAKPTVPQTPTFGVRKFTGSGIPLAGAPPASPLVSAQVGTQKAAAPAAPAPGATPSAGASNPNGVMNDINSFYGDMLGKYDQQWAGQKQQLQHQIGGYQRGAAELNARLGRSVAGGYGQMSAQATMGGMNEMQKAWLASQDQRNQLLQQYAKARIGENQRQEEHGWMIENRNETQDWQDKQLAALNGGNDPSTTDYSQASGNIAPAGSMHPGQGLLSAQQANNGQYPLPKSTVDGAAKLMGFGDYNSLPPAWQAEIQQYFASVAQQNHRAPSAGELRDRLRAVGLYK